MNSDLLTFQSLKEAADFRKAINWDDLLDPKALTDFQLGKLDHEIVKSYLPHFQKAFETQDVSDVLERTGGGALQLQSLQRTLVSYVQQMSDYRFWKTMYSLDVQQTLTEFNRILRHSAASIRDTGVYESGDPTFSQPVIERAAHNIAFTATAYAWSRVIGRVETTQDPEQVMRESAMHRMLECAATWIWYGNREVRGLEFNGFEKELRDAGRVRDCEGRLPTVTEMQADTLFIKHSAFGLANQFWMSDMSRACFNNYVQYNPSMEQVHLPTDGSGQTIILGQIVPGINDHNSRNNRLLFETDRWLDRSEWTVPMYWDDQSRSMVESALGVNAPDTPEIVSAAVTGGYPDSKWLAGDIGGPSVVKYRLVAANDEGYSRASAPFTTDVPLQAGGVVTLTLRPAPSGNRVTRYWIYRETVPENGIFRFMQQIAAEPSGGDTVHLDANWERPGTEIGILGDFNSITATGENRTYAMGFLLPLMHTKFAPGVVNMRKLIGMFEMYLGLRIFNPLKFILYKNMPTIPTDPALVATP